MRQDFEQKLVAAARFQDPSSRIALIKTAVSEQVRAADPSVIIARTDYFNHSLVPDMVLSWPPEKRERPLFVRGTSDSSWLLGGMRLISDLHPLVFTLESLQAEDINSPQANRGIYDALDQNASQSNTWVTDPSGLATMSSVRTQEPGLGLLSQALVRGGRGVLGGNDLESLSRTTSAGFTGANELSEPSTRLAIEAAEKRLNGEQSGRITRILRALWEGHGGISSKFPTTSTTGRLTDDDLSYLLASTGTATREFWTSIGRSINTEQLGRLVVDDPSESLQAFVGANLECLSAKAMRVLYDPQRLGESESIPRWYISRNCLSLRGLNWSALVAGRLTEELPHADKGESPELSTLEDRASGVSAVTQVAFGRDDRAVTYESKDGGNVLTDPELRSVAAETNLSTVQRIVAVLARGGTLGVDFPHRTAATPTSSTITLGALMRAALPLLLELPQDEMRDVLDLVKEPPEPPDLFSH